MTLNDFKGIIGFSLLGAFILICTNGMTFTGITVYDESLIESFGWTKSTLKFRDFINLAAAAAIMPFIGAFVDKFGVKRSFSFGLILLSILYYIYSYIGSAVHMYVIHLGFAVAVAASGTLVVIIMVSQRVSDNRGTAIGIALAGTSLGGIIIPKIAGALLNEFEWRQAFRYEAIVPLIILIFVLIFVKDSDRYKDGKVKTEDLEEVDFKSALRTKSFWFLAIIGFFSYYAILGLMGNLFLAMRELDFTTASAVNSLGLMSSIILVAKLISGVLTDYIDKFKLFRIQLFILFLGTVGFAMYNPSTVWYSIVVVGVGWGGLYTLINYIIITTFGVNAAGKIGGSISTFECLGAGLGIWLSGLIADKTGSYAMSFTVVAILLFLAFIFSFLLKPVQVNED